MDRAGPARLKTVELPRQKYPEACVWQPTSNLLVIWEFFVEYTFIGIWVKAQVRVSPTTANGVRGYVRFRDSQVHNGGFHYRGPAVFIQLPAGVRLLAVRANSYQLRLPGHRLPDRAVLDLSLGEVLQDVRGASSRCCTVGRGLAVRRRGTGRRGVWQEINDAATRRGPTQGPSHRVVLFVPGNK